MFPLKVVRCISSTGLTLPSVAKTTSSTSWSRKTEAERIYCTNQHVQKRDKRYINTYVDSVRKQFLIKETDSDCTEALKEGKFLLYHKGNALMSTRNRTEPILIDRSRLNHILDQKIINTRSAFLKISDDELDNCALFAVPLPREYDEEAVSKIEESFSGKFINLRLAMLFGGDNCSILSGGYSLLKWLHNTKYCSKCGSPAQKNVPGSRIVCTNEECKAIYYPPTSPVGIVLVASQDHSHVLLVRQPKYPVGMYSCVAGFVDMGESLYDCVKREVAEEAGVEILPNSSTNFKVSIDEKLYSKRILMKIDFQLKIIIRQLN